MNKILIFVAMVIVIACNKEGTSIKVNKTMDRYELTAYYPTNKEQKVKDCLKTIFKGDSLLLKDVGSGKEIKLSNGAVFYLRHNRRKLEIEMLLGKNNAKGYQFFDEIAKGVKKALN